MSKLLLIELPAGFGLVRASDKSQLDLQAWHAFQDTQDALSAAQHLVEGSLGKTMQKFLKKHIVDKKLQSKLVVMDNKLGQAISATLSVPCIWAQRKTPEMELIKSVREKICDLIKGLTDQALKQTALGLAHKLDNYKLKFSPDRLDTLVIQAIAMLDDLDKELNVYAMRLKEWYGWHFAELSKLVSDNVNYAQVVLRMGRKSQAATTDFADLVDPDVATAIKTAAVVSPGLDIADDDEINIRVLAEEVIATARYRTQLAEYIRNRMMILAPNLTTMLGEVVGARLLSAAGSLTHLAKAPASTVQILGAEKALFRAMKKHSPTPKYGLLYHAALVGRAPPKYRGRMARTLAARASLCARVDAFQDHEEGETPSYEMGTEARGILDQRLAFLEDLLARRAGDGERGGRRAPAGAASQRYDRSATLAAARDGPGAGEVAAIPAGLVSARGGRAGSEDKEKRRDKTGEKGEDDERRAKKEAKAQEKARAAAAEASHVARAEAARDKKSGKKEKERSRSAEKEKAHSRSAEKEKTHSRSAEMTSKEKDRGVKRPRDNSVDGIEAKRSRK